MPRATFENLDEAKRNAFLDAAYREFSVHGFREASVSRLVSTLGIAKGSVYQYFDDKSDLYRYLVDLAAQTKLDSISAAVREFSPARGFYALYRSIVLAGAQFDFANPRLSLLITNALHERDAPGLEDLPDSLTAQSMAFLRGFVQQGVGEGAVRADLSIELAAHFVNVVTLGIVPYLEQTHGFRLDALLLDPSQSRPFSDADLERAVDAMLELLRRGIEPR